MTPTSMWQLERDLREEIQTEAAELMQDQYPEDRLHEMVDTSVPVYTSTLMALAADDIDLAVSQPEVLAFDGEATPVNAVAGNVYERLMLAAYDEWETIKRDWEDDDDE